jgi:hypothetical protein
MSKHAAVDESTIKRYRIMTSSTKSAWVRTGVITLTMMAATYAWTQYAGHEAAATPMAEQRPVTPTLSRNPLGGLMTDAAAPSVSTNGSFVEDLQQANEQADAQQALVEQAIVSEKLDPSWAPRAEASLHSLFEQSEIHSLKLLSAQCRATICRIEIAPSDSEGTGDFDRSFRRMLLHMPWQGQGFGRVYNPFGPSPTAVFFLAREGASLPQPIS